MHELLRTKEGVTPLLFLPTNQPASPSTNRLGETVCSCPFGGFFFFDDSQIGSPKAPAVNIKTLYKYPLIDYNGPIKMTQINEQLPT